jgi:hypothetical protein
MVLSRQLRQSYLDLGIVGGQVLPPCALHYMVRLDAPPFE